MKYLLDTNALIYSLCSPEELSVESYRGITSEKELYVSIVSFWEIAIKQTLGKLNIKASIPEIEQICVGRDITLIPILSKEIEFIKTLPLLHKDLFDRLLISQAKNQDLILITSDTIIPQYDVKTLW